MQYIRLCRFVNRISRMYKPIGYSNNASAKSSITSIHQQNVVYGIRQDFKSAKIQYS